MVFDVFEKEVILLSQVFTAAVLFAIYGGLIASALLIIVLYIVGFRSVPCCHPILCVDDVCKSVCVWMRCLEDMKHRLQMKIDR